MSIGALAHLWGEPQTMRQMELRVLREHEELIVAIDFELISTAMRCAGVLAD